jgi:ribose transport system substrate-binding protein
MFLADIRTRLSKGGTVMKRIVAVLLASALVIAGACSGRQGTDPRAKLRFAVIPKSLDIPVFNYAKVGAEQAAKELGNVEILWNAPLIADQRRQKEMLESFITRKVDGIAISCTNGDFLTPAINRAVEAGIPVVTWDSDAPNSKRHAFYGIDDFASGRMLGEEAIKLLKGKGDVAIMTSVGATNLQRRLDGIQEALKKAPKIKVVEVFDLRENPLAVSDVIAEGVQKYPQLAAWLSTGGLPVFNRDATAALDPNKTKLLSFDTIDPALDLLREGKVQVLIGQKYFGWGSQPVKLLYDIKQGKMPATPIIDSGVDVVTRENVDQYAEQWKKMAAGGQ